MKSIVETIEQALRDQAIVRSGASVAMSEARQTLEYAQLAYNAAQATYEAALVVERELSGLHAELSISQPRRIPVLRAGDPRPAFGEFPEICDIGGTVRHSRPAFQEGA